MKIYGVAGWKNTGKTTLLTRLVEEIVGRGVAVSTIKHAHHHFDVDHEGKDSWRHRQAGAREVLVSSAKRWALMHEIAADETEPPLEALIAKLEPVDLALIEGYKRDRHPKIEAHLLGTRQPPIALEDPTIRAVATDADADAWKALGLDRPDGPRRLDINDIVSVADFVLAETGLSGGLR